MVHLGCLHKAFKDAGNEAMKIKLDLLADFIQFSTLVYQCKACNDKFSTAPSKPIPIDTMLVNVSDAKVTDEISNIKQSIVTLDGKISSILSSISLNNGCLQSFTTPNVSASTNAPKKSYAEVTSMDIVKVVQNAVTDSLRSKNEDNLAMSSIIIFGLPESSNDLTKVRRLLEDDIQSVVRIQRLGKFSKPLRQQTGANVSIIRPLRVQLKQVEDRNWVLRNAGWLIRAFGNSNVHIAKCLTAKEIENIKKLRIECSRLNSFVPKLDNGKCRLVVVNSKIMERSEGGQLVPYDSLKWASGIPITTSVNGTTQKSGSDSVASSVPKNVYGGSQRTPS
jgi:hypothetical protein